MGRYSDVVHLRRGSSLGNASTTLGLVNGRIPMRLIITCGSFGIVPIRRFRMRFVGPLAVSNSVDSGFISTRVSNDFLDITGGFAFAS